MINESMSGNTMWAGHWLWMVVIAIVVVAPVWRICRRTGYPAGTVDAGSYGQSGFVVLYRFCRLACE